jgi:hypothetical protein
MEESFGYRRSTTRSSRPPGDGSSFSLTTIQPSIFRLFTSAELQLANRLAGRAIHVTERKRGRTCEPYEGANRILHVFGGSVDTVLNLSGVEHADASPLGGVPRSAPYHKRQPTEKCSRQCAHQSRVATLGAKISQGDCDFRLM